ncbi:hypothetical protein [Microbulbifer sp. SAOS-129_SWC]|uniref:hypothetical protein n=1 Tax=Microbulbifer sp. SAOS-129_SWC TaxID=3145235 RepID=UPI003217460C
MFLEAYTTPIDSIALPEGSTSIIGQETDIGISSFNGLPVSPLFSRQKFAEKVQSGNITLEVDLYRNLLDHYEPSGYSGTIFFEALPGHKYMVCGKYFGANGRAEFYVQDVTPGYFGRVGQAFTNL